MIEVPLPLAPALASWMVGPLRPCEGVMVVLTAMMTLRMIGLWWPQGWARLAFVLGMIGLGVAHVLLEGWRWQMGPLYLAALIVTVWTAIPRWSLLASRIGAGLGFLAIFASFILAVVVPIFKLVPPGGPYAVGTRLYDLTDTDRPDPEGNGMEPRRLTVQVWYPAVPETGKGVAAYRRRGSDWPLSHLRLVPTNGVAQADLDTSQRSWPLVLLITEPGVVRSMHTGLVQELASRGYVVAVFAAASRMSRDPAAFFSTPGMSPEMQRDWLQGARLDPRAVLQAMQTAFDGRVDTRRTLILASDISDFVATTACLMDANVTAILSFGDAFVPRFVGSNGALSTVGAFPCPVLVLNGAGPKGAPPAKEIASGWSVGLRNASNGVLNEWPLYLRMKDVTGVDGRTYAAADALIRRYAVAFADWALRGDEATLLAKPALGGVAVTPIGTPQRRE